MQRLSWGADSSGKRSGRQVCHINAITSMLHPSPQLVMHLMLSPGWPAQFPSWLFGGHTLRRHAPLQKYRRALDIITQESGLSESSILDIRGNHDVFDMGLR